jgi:hypothetical protein|uniref:Uncharacterized protein n=1 Tax=Zea mays TaxID=4577 RepID=A0A804NWD3_MAIZE
MSADNRPLEAEEPPPSVLEAATQPPFENGAATSPPSEIGARTLHPVLGAAATTATYHSTGKLLPLSCVRSLHVHRSLSPSTSASPSPLVCSLPPPAAPHAASHQPLVHHRASNPLLATAHLAVQTHFLIS